MMGEDTTRDMYSSFPEINKTCKVASHWNYIKRNILTMHGPLNLKSVEVVLYRVCKEQGIMQIDAARYTNCW